MPAHELLILEHALQLERIPAALGLLQRLRASGMLYPHAADEGAPTNAFVAHAEVVRAVGLQAPNDFGIVTTDEVKAAFELFEAEAAPGHARVEVLRRAITSPLLLRRPLERTQVDDLFRKVGVDGRGFVSCARFNGQLGVLPPLQLAPKRAGCLGKCVGKLADLLAGGAKTAQGTFDEDAVSDDGTLASTDGLRPMSRPREFAL